MEDKALIATKLGELLKLTRIGEGIEKINYGKAPHGEEYCYIIFKNGNSIKVNVTADSGVALISDVIRRISTKKKNVISMKRVLTE